LGRSNINEIATFVTVVSAGSFTLAGKQMGLTRSAVAKSVVRLEERLGIRLLNRTPRSLSLTDDGEVFLDRCVKILADLDDAEAAMTLRSEVPNGTIRINLPIVLGQRHVLPIIQDFLRKWPAVGAEVTFTDRFVDLIEEAVDVAIRIGPPGDDSLLITRTIAEQHLVTCAAPAYLEAHGVPERPSDLEHHHCLFFVNDGRRMSWAFFDAGRTTQMSMPGQLQMNSADALLYAAVDGAGVVHLPTYLVGGDIRKGSLVPILNDFRCESAPIRVVYSNRRHLSLKVRVFIDLLVQTWGDIPPWERDLVLP
jgi:DNA-binding transcriptional LysR family regulator